MSKPTTLAPKSTLAFTVGAFDVSAFGTSLARVARVNCNDTNAFGYGLVFEEGPQLSKSPRVQASFSPSSFRLNSAANLREVLQYNRRANTQTFENLFGKNVVAIAPESLPASRKAFEVATSRPAAVRLERALQVKNALLYIFPLSFTVKAVVTAYGWPRNSEVNPDGFARVHQGMSGTFTTKCKYHLLFLQTKSAVAVSNPTP